MLLCVNPKMETEGRNLSHALSDAATSESSEPSGAAPARAARIVLGASIVQPRPPPPAQGQPQPQSFLSRTQTHVEKKLDWQVRLRAQSSCQACHPRFLFEERGADVVFHVRGSSALSSRCEASSPPGPSSLGHTHTYPRLSTCAD